MGHGWTRTFMMREIAAGQLVTVKAYRTEQIDPLFAAVVESIQEPSRYETWCHPGYTRGEAAEYVDWWRKTWGEGKAYYFGVEHAETGAFLGSCGLSDLSMEHKRAELGFWIRSSRTGKGFATGTFGLDLIIGATVGLVFSLLFGLYPAVLAKNTDTSAAIRSE